MRNCLGVISGYFSSSWKNFPSSCLSCLSCFGSLQNNQMSLGQVVGSRDDDTNRVASAEIVFSNLFPDLYGHKENPIPESQNLIPQTQTLDEQTQTSEAEIEISEQKAIEAIELENIASKEQDINNKDRQIKALTELGHFQEIQISELTASLRQLEARLVLLENSEQGLVPEPEPENQTQVTNSTPSPSSQERSAFGVLQDSSSSQINYSDYKVLDIDSSSQWGVEGYKMLSPLICQIPSTIEGLQDFSDSLTSSDQVYDSFLENKNKYSASNNSQSSTGSLTQSTETNISYFPKDDKTMERNLILLKEASIDVVDGVSDFSEVMDAITKDLKKTINDPSYPTKSIALAPPSPSPSFSASASALREATPRVLDFRVLGNTSKLVVC